jgi:lipid-A-disaccharide synthase
VSAPAGSAAGLSTRAAGRRVLISCGEASGDLYAAALVDEMRRIDPHLVATGFGGERLKAAGADLIGDYRGLTVTGLVEAAGVLRKSWRMLGAIAKSAREQRPDVFVAIDFPDFNFRLLPMMQRLGVPIVYYVSPQIWAWRASRIHTLKQYVTRMLVIFPFEVPLYERASVPVEFVGHPLVDLAAVPAPRETFLRTHSLDPGRPVLALLPGSRPSELRHNLPAMAEAVPLIASKVPGLQVLVARAPALDDALLAPLDAVKTSGVPIAIPERASDDVLAASDVVITASGTATVQAALHGRPMVIVYRLSPVTYHVGRAFVRVSTYGMVNLVAGRSVVPELIQDAFDAESVAREAVSLFTDRARADAMRHDLAEVVARLGGSGASRRAAEAVLRVAREGPRG